MNYLKVLFCICFCFLLSCKKQKQTKLNDNEIYTAFPLKIKEPKNNISNPDKVQLGKLLFYDPILSGNKDVACATCHHPDFGYAEPLDLSIGVNGVGFGRKRHFKPKNKIPFVKRNAHTILNTAYNGITTNSNYTPEKAPMFWDMRSISLENQSLQPILSLEEMRGDKISKKHILDSIIKRLNKIDEYQFLFAKAFPENKKIDTINIAKAIASFERSLTTPNSRFDQFINGNTNAISETEKDGFELFKKAKCNNCHSGPMFSDYKTHILGVKDNGKLSFSDDGFQKTYSFRTPTLRNLRHTAPYMHNGKITTLKKVLEFYEDISGGKSQNKHVKNLDPLVLKINIKGKDMSPILSFFNTLNSENFDKEIPKKVPSGLSVGGEIN